MVTLAPASSEGDDSGVAVPSRGAEDGYGSATSRGQGPDDELLLTAGAVDGVGAPSADSTFICPVRSTDAAPLMATMLPWAEMTRRSLV